MGKTLTFAVDEPFEATLLEKLKLSFKVLATPYSVEAMVHSPGQLIPANVESDSSLLPQHSFAYQPEHGISHDLPLAIVRRANLNTPSRYTTEGEKKLTH